METKFGFELRTVDEFVQWFSNIRIARTILYVQQHHTAIPNYKHFNGRNHFELQKGMKNSHVLGRGWIDIGQHFTIFPDGMVMTGRSLEVSPAGIYGKNSHSICIENLGNFDRNGDVMTHEQRESIIKVTAAICSRLAIPINTDRIVYHHWYRLDNGVRNNGSGGNKTCPGTNFFGGNKVADCETHFLPLVLAELNGSQPVMEDRILKYVSVTATRLNIRKKADLNSAKVADREPVKFGAILRVYEEKDGWFRISNSKQHWVSGMYTQDVKRATANASALNVRDRAGVHGTKIGLLKRGEELFVYEEKDSWCRICVEQKWVKKSYLTF